ncbi:hypothetical protein BHT95_15650 [Bacillus paralicheniformis]|nr:hypothetical protein BHT95_15650 [Bacillus paralicheniformis]
MLNAGSTFVEKIRGSIKWVSMILSEHAAADWFVFSESGMFELQRLPVLKRAPPQNRKESLSVLLPRLEQTLFFSCRPSFFIYPLVFR